MTIGRLEELSPADVSDVLAALERLDDILKCAVGVMRETTPEAGDPYRGLYLAPRDIDRLLARRPGASSLDADGPAAWLASGSGPRVESLGRAFDLSPFEQAVILLALAPELDLRYERLYAFLQDDVTKKRPTIDLALNLFGGASWEARLEQRASFSPDAPLVREGLVRLVADPNLVAPPLLTRYLALDDQIVSILLGRDELVQRWTPSFGQVFVTAKVESGVMIQATLG